MFRFRLGAAGKQDAQHVQVVVVGRFSARNF
jgi:hypothetical protein